MHTEEDRCGDKEKAGLESPTSQEIIQSLCKKKPVDTQRFLDRFTQAFIQRQRDRKEQEHNEQLREVESSMNEATASSSKISKVTTNNSHRQSSGIDIDLNEEAIISDDCAEEFGDNNVPLMQAEDVQFHSGRQHIDENNNKPASNNNSSTQGQLHDNEIEEALNLEPPTAEEKEMDRMFTDNKYPTIEEISGAHAPEVGMEFDSREEAFLFLLFMLGESVLLYGRTLL